MILSQKYQPGTHSTPAEIPRELNIDRQSVSCIIDPNLHFHPLRKRKEPKLTDLNTEKRMIRSRKLLSKYPQKILKTVFLSDKKIFSFKQLYNSHNDFVHVQKKMRKLEVQL